MSDDELPEVEELSVQELYKYHKSLHEGDYNIIHDTLENIIHNVLGDEEYYRSLQEKILNCKIDPTYKGYVCIYQSHADWL
jgi:hypothetical protein